MLMLTLGEAGLEAALDLLARLVMLASLLVLESVLELDLRLPSQSREMERLRCLCFFDIGGLGGREGRGENWPREVRAAASITEATPLLELLAEVSTYITAPIFWDMERAWGDDTTSVTLWRRSL